MDVSAAVDVAAMANQNVKQQADMAILRKSMDTRKASAQQMLDGFSAGNRSIERAAQPHLGSRIDVRL